MYPSDILLNIAIRVSTRGGAARIQNCENSLDDLAAVKGEPIPPVIIMVERSAADALSTAEAMLLAARLMRKGAMDFIEKPFPKTGRTLDEVIKKVLAERRSRVVPPEVKVTLARRRKQQPSPDRKRDAVPGEHAPVKEAN